MTYSEKLKDPRWQRKRLEILTRDEWRCAECESAAKTLHVHHLYYISGREPWAYPDWWLHALCDECHKLRGETQKEEFQHWEFLMDMLVAQDPKRIYELYEAVDNDRCENMRPAIDLFRIAVKAFTQEGWRQ